MFKIDPDLKGANVSRTIRFTESLYKRLNEYSFKHDVSFNYLVLQCCKYALDNSDETIEEEK